MVKDYWKKAEWCWLPYTIGVPRKQFKITEDIKANKGEGCEMLDFDKDNKAVCKLREKYGNKALPEACVKFPESNEQKELCLEWRKKANRKI